MPRIELKNVTKRWGNFYGCENLDLLIEDNSFVTLLGPSGCGKTTVLRMIAGLETPTKGKITIGDQVVFDSDAGINIPASKRKVGFLFQNYALWPNMTVYQNISFGLKSIKEEMSVIDSEAKAIAAILKAIENPKKIVDLINDCKDKKGKIDEKRALMKLIDTYHISIYSAQKIMNAKMHEGNNIEDVCAKFKTDLLVKQNNINEEHKKKNEVLNENFEVTLYGKPILKVRKLDKEEIDLKVRRVARIVKVGMFMERYPAELSGGQQQRVAIARTLAPGPTVLFMDEPLSNLDAKLRLEMRYELQRLHVETGSTFVYVTHDQMEAMTLATKICLINNGVLQQYEEPLKTYNYPANTFAGDFIGNPSINFIEAKGKQEKSGEITLKLLGDLKATFKPEDKTSLNDFFKDRDARIKSKKAQKQAMMKDKNYVEKGNKDELFKYHIAKVKEIDETILKEYKPVDGDFVIGVRPEFIELTKSGAVEGEIYGAMPTGMESTIKVRVGEFLLTCVVFGGKTYPIGSKTNIKFSSSKIMLFDRVSGERICDGTLTIKE